jgi:hypothetical protein
MTFIYTITIIVTFLAMSGKAANILANPGFNTTLFTAGGWTQHAGQTWMENQSAIPGDGTVKTVTYTVAGTRRFYRLQIQ